jgi:phosphate uptake regulator
MTEGSGQDTVDFDTVMAALYYQNSFRRILGDIGTIEVYILSGRSIYIQSRSIVPLDMDIRRVQMTGGSSYVLTLPKEWIKSLQIKKNDPLGIVIREDGDLFITGNITGEMVQQKKIIEVVNESVPNSFYRTLIGAYIAGYHCIEIKSKDRVPPLIRKSIRSFADQVIGLEPVQESESAIILRDLFNPLEMPFESSLNRMYSITKEMINDSVKALISHDTALADHVILRDRDVDRLFWLIARQTNIILESPWNSERMNNSITEIFHFYQTGRIIERIADHAVSIAKSIQLVDVSTVTEKTSAAVYDASQEAIKAFDISVSAFFTHDMKGANRIIESVYLYEKTFHHINEEIFNLPTESAVHIRRISDSIRRIGEYSVDIAEGIINQGVTCSNDTLE